MPGAADRRRKPRARATANPSRRRARGACALGRDRSRNGGAPCPARRGAHRARARGFLRQQNPAFALARDAARARRCRADDVRVAARRRRRARDAARKNPPPHARDVRARLDRGSRSFYSRLESAPGIAGVARARLPRNRARARRRRRRGANGRGCRARHDAARQTADDLAALFFGGDDFRSVRARSRAPHRSLRPRRRRCDDRRARVDRAVNVGAVGGVVVFADGGFRQARLDSIRADGVGFLSRGVGGGGVVRARALSRPHFSHRAFSLAFVARSDGLRRAVAVFFRARRAAAFDFARVDAHRAGVFRRAHDGDFARAAGGANRGGVVAFFRGRDCRFAPAGGRRRFALRRGGVVVGVFRRLRVF